MHPILFKVGPITVYSYGFILAVAFLVSFFVAAFEARRKEISDDVVYDLILAAIIGGIFGARFFYVVANFDYFFKFPLQIFVIQEGLVFYGGLTGGIIAVLLVSLRKKIPVCKVADISAPCLALGGAIGRIGCLLNGCCYGKPSNLFWAIKLPHLSYHRHPTQVYDLLYNLLIFGIIWRTRKRIDRDGIIFWVYLFLYSIGRFFVEFFRVSRVVLLGLTGAQLISVCIFIISSIVLFKKYTYFSSSKS
ncbi:MAG TPA: prolipoprotein diacylglyceryl transferase [Actinobacteria bacterium]|nr:prolipoprotein diacylglyceryl transferase [Actinomycetota bacterium]